MAACVPMRDVLEIDFVDAELCMLGTDRCPRAIDRQAGCRPITRHGSVSAGGRRCDERSGVERERQH